MKTIKPWQERLDRNSYEGAMLLEIDEWRAAAHAAKEAKPASPPVPIKDHEIAKLVNDLRDIAVKYHDTQQLRERIAHAIRPLCTQPVSAKP